MREESLSAEVVALARKSVFFLWIKFATEHVRTMDESLRLRGRRLSLLKLMRKEKTTDMTHRPGAANRSNCKH